MCKTITVLVVEPMKEPYVKEIETSLKGISAVVGGPIQSVYPFDEPVELICNEEGKMNGLTPNRPLCDYQGRIYDVVMGTFIIAGLNEDMDNLISLSDELIKVFSEKFKQPVRFVFFDGELKAIPI